MLQQNAQDNLPKDAGVKTDKVETIDDITQAGQPESSRNIVDRQINLANRSAS